MAVVHESAALGQPAWQRERVPVEEVCQWVQALGGQVGLAKSEMYLLGDVVDAYVWEQEATWSVEQLYWSIQHRMFPSVLGWYQSVVLALGAAERCWESAGCWAERSYIERALMPSQLEWIAERKRQLGTGRQEFCRECAAFCEQQGWVFPEWLQVALGLVSVPQGREEA